MLDALVAASGLQVEEPVTAEAKTLAQYVSAQRHLLVDVSEAMVRTHTHTHMQLAVIRKQWLARVLTSFEMCCFCAVTTAAAAVAGCSPSLPLLPCASGCAV